MFVFIFPGFTKKHLSYNQIFSLLSAPLLPFPFAFLAVSQWYHKKNKNEVYKDLWKNPKAVKKHKISIQRLQLYIKKKIKPRVAKLGILRKGPLIKTFFVLCQSIRFYFANY